MADVLTKEQRRRNMQSIRSKETKIEIKVANALWKRGVRFRKNVKDLIGKPDIAIKKYKIAIFIDSCFWHGCELHGHIPKNNELYWLKKISRNKERDQQVTSYYLESGWNIMRIWEHELKEDFEGTVQKITNLINQVKQM